MDARLVRAAVMVAALVSLGASYRTPNFVVNAPTQDIATQIGQQAETYRRDLAVLWLGKPLPNWAQPCPITAQVAEHLGAGGATSFMFDHGEVFGWTMTIQGSLERILDSVLPHEVTHTIFASHFRRPLPRWADEGACTTVEHASERGKQQQMLIQFLRTNRGIPFHSMFAMKEYPADVLPLYAQGHSLASFLIQQGGRQKFLNFVAAGLQGEQWPAAVQQNYGFANLAALQNSWLDWVRKGSPAISAPNPSADTQLAANAPRPRPEPNLIVRGQSSDSDDAAPAPAANHASGVTKAPLNNLAGNLVPVTRPLGARNNGPAPEMTLAANTRLPGPASWQQMEDAVQRASQSRDPFQRAPGGDANRHVLLEWGNDASNNQRAVGGSSGTATGGPAGASVYAPRTNQPLAAP
ncbi:MAG TPA: hypothetical protein VHD36_17230 [Pirellulales bacterium]|nr:hypothetical protein [Pirellulales bacterium]